MNTWFGHQSIKIKHITIVSTQLLLLHHHLSKKKKTIVAINRKRFLDLTYLVGFFGSDFRIKSLNCLSSCIVYYCRCATGNFGRCDTLSPSKKTGELIKISSHSFDVWLWLSYLYHASQARASSVTFFWPKSLHCGPRGHRDRMWSLV